jgi:integrase
MCQFLFHTNLRVGDALLLEWRDVLTDEGIVRRKLIIQREQKTRKKKVFPITEPLAEYLFRFYEKYHPRLYDKIFQSSSPRVKGSGRAWRRESVWVFIQEACVACGIEGDYGCHSFRKAWATEALKNGTKEEVVSEALNHTSVRETRRYLGINYQVLEKEYIKVSEQLKLPSDLEFPENKKYERNYTRRKPECKVTTHQSKPKRSSVRKQTTRTSTAK